MRIVQVRGTSGSGKSTVVRSFMESAEWDGVGSPGRRRPMYYVSTNLPSPVVVLGHYESPCGGCDTVGSAREVYGLIGEVAARHPGARVLCEGLLLSEDVKWTSLLASGGGDVRCLFLTTPVEECLRRVGRRRGEAGNNEPLDPANTVRRVGVIDRARVRLLGSGVNCVRCSSRQAAGVVGELILGGVW